VTGQWLRWSCAPSTVQSRLASEAAGVGLGTHRGRFRGTAATLEAVEQVLACQRKRGSPFLEVVMIYSALKLKWPCFLWAAVAFMIFKHFVRVQSS